MSRFSKPRAVDCVDWFIESSEGNCAESFGIQEAESTGTVASALRLFELASVFMRLDHVARFIVNTDHSIM